MQVSCLAYTPYYVKVTGWKMVVGRRCFFSFGFYSLLSGAPQLLVLGRVYNWISEFLALLCLPIPSRFAFFKQTTRPLLSSEKFRNVLLSPAALKWSSPCGLWATAVGFKTTGGNLWYFRYTFPPIVMEVKVGPWNNSYLSNTAILSFSTFMVMSYGRKE